MADSMDLEQERQAETLARQINNARQLPTQPGAFFCEECGEPIPEVRRAAIFGVTTCVFCQSLLERHAAHLKGSNQ
ncbi:TraR/DksA family transcriptional regulator [Pantoea agglomerans]|uniref:TraR/DksA family transcriptional regulator n=1 Tax=Enterobacter agglomerans TaxID=549 RepID=A0ACC5RR70_ENTAG|nr:TraR/DksA family transcriptional regulator [Pantoea agglomerans]MBK4727204.1 TraR/DksA family transcriptional regulator [Pantoea agglomerans]